MPCLGRLLFGLALATMLTSCSELSPTTYRYRITVEVETPQGLKTASSVVEVAVSQTIGLPDRNLIQRTRGEAVILDLPSGHQLVIPQMDAHYIGVGEKLAPIAYAARIPPDPKRHWRGYTRLLASQRGAVVLPRDRYPIMLIFPDRQSPRGLAIADPANLDTASGRVRVRRITIEIGDFPLVRSLPGRLSWWAAYRRKNLDGSDDATVHVQNPDPAAHLTPGWLSNI